MRLEPALQHWLQTRETGALTPTPGTNVTLVTFNSQLKWDTMQKLLKRIWTEQFQDTVKGRFQHSWILVSLLQ